MSCLHYADAADLEAMTTVEKGMQIILDEAEPASTSSQDLSASPEEPEDCDDMGPEPEPIMTFDVAVKQAKALTRFLLAHNFQGVEAIMNIQDDIQREHVKRQISEKKQTLLSSFWVKKDNK